MANRNSSTTVTSILESMDISPEHIRWYSIAGIPIQVEADLPFRDDTFNEKFQNFQIDAPEMAIVRIRHEFSIVPPVIDNTFQRIHKKIPWEIYKKENLWIYLGILEDQPSDLWIMGIFNETHTEGLIYHRDSSQFLKGNNQSLSLFPTDQIVVARILAEKQAIYLHAAGMILDGQGVLFVGHSEAGKSTTVTMLKDEGEILCDDRVILRRWPDGFKIHGTWSHGDVPDVSNSSTPLRAIFFIEKSEENLIVPIEDPREISRLLPFYVVRPLVTEDWWNKTLDLIGHISRDVPVYRLYLDKSGKVKDVLKAFLCQDPEPS